MKSTEDKRERYRAWGREVLEDEAASVLFRARSLDNKFSDAVEMILKCRGRVVVAGLGKSGHVGRKIAATFSSLGTPAHFVHAAEALHGDLGMILPGDVVIGISSSGTTKELKQMLSVLKARGIVIIAMTGKMASPVAELANIVLDISVSREADPWNLAPTASSTVTLALGDALAVAVARARNFDENEFGINHPGGALGARTGRVKK